MAILLSDIKVHYPGVKALDGVTVEFREGIVHGVIGENGAGKSTLMKILSGAKRPTEGHIAVDGKIVHFSKPADAVSHGIAMVSQEGSLIPSFTAAENITLGHEFTKMGRIVDTAKAISHSQALLKQWFPDTLIDFDKPCSEMAYADQKVVEILRALSSNPRILILDEPTATLPSREKQSLWALIRSISNAGVGVVLISHFMSEVLELSDHITALRDGRLVRTTRAAGLSERDLVEMMFSREIHEQMASTSRLPDSENNQIDQGDIILSCNDWTGLNFKIDELEIARGEIIGLIGLTGAGHSEFARSLFDPKKAQAGHMIFLGSDMSNASCRKMMSSGMAYIPDHRMINALIGDWSIRENTSLVSLPKLAVSALRLIRPNQEIKATEEAAANLNVKMSSVEQKVHELSGGNKQKISIARWLCPKVERQLFIFVEPTEGVDIHSKAEIHRVIRSLAHNGAAVFVASSDLMEVMALAHRIVPFVSGMGGESIQNADISEDRLIDSITGEAA